MAGNFLNIREDFYGTLLDIGSNLSSAMENIALANTPIAGSLKVYLDGKPTTAYTYDVENRPIKFDSGLQVPSGTEIKVVYDRLREAS